MWKSRIHQTLLCVCCIVILTESAILRSYRRQASLLATDKPRNGRGVGSMRYSDQYYKSRQFSGNFRPNPRRCCQIGERVAQKRMSCDITVLAMLRKYHNIMLLSSLQQQHPTNKLMLDRPSYGFNSRLSEKVAKCSAVHPRLFGRCCEAEDRSLRETRRCQLLAKSREERRRCRHSYSQFTRRK